VQHQFGAKSLAASTALILADRQVQRILDAIERAGIKDKTTIIVVSDHGFKAYHHLIQGNVLLRQKGLLRDKDGQVDCDGWVMAEGGTAMVYVMREAQRAAVLKVVDEEFPSVPGIVKVIKPEEYPQYGYPKVEPGGRMADRVLVAASDYAFSAATSGDLNIDVPGGGIRGNHGYVNSDPEMKAILVMWGAGVEPGSRVPEQPNVNVATTIAHLLGLKLPQSAATPISGLLSKE
jgi:predicted AlkP superfamily pyrophosphatase or phosphodiesterase